MVKRCVGYTIFRFGLLLKIPEYPPDLDAEFASVPLIDITGHRTGGLSKVGGMVSVEKAGQG